jgi:Sec-independent protein translocase protein TatA
MFGSIGIPEILVGLLIIGSLWVAPKALPAIGRKLGGNLREMLHVGKAFREGLEDTKEVANTVVDETRKAVSEVTSESA